jgi:hypothetical protein
MEPNTLKLFLKERLKVGTVEEALQDLSHLLIEMQDTTNEHDKNLELVIAGLDELMEEIPTQRSKFEQLSKQFKDLQKAKNNAEKNLHITVQSLNESLSRTLQEASVHRVVSKFLGKSAAKTQLNPLGANMNEVVIGPYTILFSYKTPVAYNEEGKGFFRTDQRFSQTTSKHINTWLSGAQATVVPQSQIEMLLG